MLKKKVCSTNFLHRVIKKGKKNFMGYEYILVIPIIIFIGMVLMYYQKKWRYKYLILVLTILVTFFYSFVHPGIFGIKKKPPYVYWCGGKKNSVGKKFDLSFKKLMEKLGFEFID